MNPTFRRFLAQSLYPSLQARMLSTRVATHYRLEELHIWQFIDVLFFFRIFKVCTEMGDLSSRKLILTRFNLENILSNLTLETGTVKNNLIITGTLLQPLLLGAEKILRHITRYETPARKRVSIAYSTNLYHCSKRSGTDTFVPPSINGIRNCTHMENTEKIKLFYI